MCSLRSSDPMYDRLLSYRYYRLPNGKHGVNAARMIKLRTFIKRLDITMKGNHFDGTDMTSVFQFLMHLFTEVDKMNTPKVKAYLALYTYFIGKANSQFTPMQSVIRTGGITCWPEATQLFLRNYRTSNFIWDAVAELHNIRQQ